MLGNTEHYRGLIDTYVFFVFVYKAGVMELNSWITSSGLILLIVIVEKKTPLINCGCICLHSPSGGFVVDAM